MPTVRIVAALGAAALVAAALFVPRPASGGASLDDFLLPDLDPVAPYDISVERVRKPGADSFRLRFSSAFPSFL